jgi:membrane protease YdiL (CAAX protease family)
MTTPATDSGPAVPVESAEYHASYRTPALRWWQPLLALGLFVAGWGAAVLAAAIGAVVYELAIGGATVEQLGEGAQTPALFLANNVGVAMAIPVAVAVQWIVFRQRPGWLFSVEGRLRWHLLTRFLLIAAVAHLAVLGVWLATSGPPDDLGVRPETWFLLATVVLTTPLQAGGEEVAFRGLATRAVGAWFGDERLGLVVSTAATALVFTVVHGSAEAWLVVFYLSLAVAASLLTWRAGGLEAAIALHVVVNLTTMLFVPFLGLEAAADPERGEVQAVAQVLAILLTSAAFVWHARRAGIEPRRKAS